jgi:hypothetical protein
MDPEPLPRKIYEEAKRLSVSKIFLNFRGVSDEGWLNVGTEIDTTTDVGYVLNGSQDVSHNNALQKLEDEIESWAWSAYSYGGAGDGTDYGDDIIYDLTTGKVTTEEWYMVREDQGEHDHELEIEEPEDEDAADGADEHSTGGV